jgi:hypothetical protein
VLQKERIFILSKEIFFDFAYLFHDILSFYVIFHSIFSDAYERIVGQGEGEGELISEFQATYDDRFEPCSRIQHQVNETIKLTRNFIQS